MSPAIGLNNKVTLFRYFTRENRLRAHEFKSHKTYLGVLLRYAHTGFMVLTIVAETASHLVKRRGFTDRVFN